MDLTTTYLGMKLRTPLVPSASPLSEDIDNIKRMEDAGASAVVLASLFEEQLLLDRYELHHHLTHGTESFASVLLRHGVGHIRSIEQGLRQWMEEREYESVGQMRGSRSQIHCENPGEFERAQYVRALHSYRPALAQKAALR